MKKIIILLTIGVFAIGLTSCKTTSSLPFSGTTKHKPIKRMKNKEVRKSQNGTNLYHYRNGKLLRR